MHVGLVVEGPKGEGHPDPLFQLPGLLEIRRSSGEGVGPPLTQASLDPVMPTTGRAGEPSEGAELLEGEKRIGHTQHDGAQCSRPVDDKAFDALGAHLGEVVMATVRTRSAQ